MNKQYSPPCWFKYASCFGVIPYYDPGRNIKTCSFKRKLSAIIYSLVILVIYGYIQVNKFQSFFILKFIYITEFFVDLVVFILCVQAVLKNTFLYNDEWLRLYHFQVGRQRNFKVCCNTFIWGHVIFIFTFCFEMSSYVTLFGFSFYWPYCFSIILYYYALLPLIILVNFLININNGYKELNKLIKTRMIGFMEINKAKRSLRKLNTIMRDVNDVFGWDVLLQFIFAGLQLLTCLCYSAEYFAEQKYSKLIFASSVIGALVCVVMIILKFPKNYFSNVFMFQLGSVVVSFTCHKIVINVQKISSTCYKILESDVVSTELRNELFFLAHYIKDEPSEFTAAGFFNVNRSTLCSLFSVTITYFIVALQLTNYIK